MSFKLEVDRVIADIALLERAGVSGCALADAGAQRLRGLLPHADRLRAMYRPAHAGEELVYLVASEPITGISLYLVSNGPGSFTPPHEQPSWSAVLGLAGVEDNRFYRRIDAVSHVVSEVGRRMVGHGDTLAHVDNTIHSTLVAGRAPTFQLHLYGKPAASLPALRSRVYTAQRVA
jgi:predicted metal-dependent enzyme (double-stranded beta helix superfamily)